MLFTISLWQGLQTTSRGPDAGRETISSGLRSHFVNDEKIIHSTYEKFVDLVEYVNHNPQQSHCVRCPALDMLCITLSGPRTKKFGDAWPMTKSRVSQHMRRGPKSGRETNWLDKWDITILVKFTRKLKVSLQWIYFFCIFWGNIVIYAVNCLLWCLPELLNDNKNRHDRLCVVTPSLFQRTNRYCPYCVHSDTKACFWL